ELNPMDEQTRSALGDLYAATGQRRMANANFAMLILARPLAFKQLVLLTDFERRDPEIAALLQQFHSTAPNDPSVNLGLAVEELSKGELASARQRLERVLASDSSLAVAQGFLGELLIDQGD